MKKQGMQVHRFHDAVAVYLGNGETVYIDPDVALNMFKQVRECVKDIDARPFVDSTFKTYSSDFDADAKSVSFPRCEDGVRNRLPYEVVENPGTDEEFIREDDRYLNLEGAQAQAARYRKRNPDKVFDVMKRDHKGNLTTEF